MAVKERSTTTDAMFEPLKQSIELLKSYEQELSEETHTLLQVDYIFFLFIISDKQLSMRFLSSYCEIITMELAVIKVSLGIEILGPLDPKFERILTWIYIIFFFAMFLFLYHYNWQKVSIDIWIFRFLKGLWNFESLIFGFLNLQIFTSIFFFLLGVTREMEQHKEDQCDSQTTRSTFAS